MSVVWAGVRERVRRAARLTLACGVVVATVAAAAQTLHPPGPHRHPEAADRENPQPATPASLDEGRKYYTFYCVSCHGQTGDGRGVMVLADSPPADFTDDEWEHGSTDGELFAVIRDGGSTPDMEGYGRRLTEDRIWHVVNFIRTLRRP